jgi:hypothetical protein
MRWRVAWLSPLMALVMIATLADGFPYSVGQIEGVPAA